MKGSENSWQGDDEDVDPVYTIMYVFWGADDALCYGVNFMSLRVIAGTSSINNFLTCDQLALK